MSDKTVGLVQKYNVERTDGKPIEWCFVLEIKDPIARLALKSYANEARTYGYNALADDLEKKLSDYDWWESLGQPDR